MVPTIPEKPNNLENQIQEVLDNNLAIKNANVTRGISYELPPNSKIKIDYLAWFIQLLIWTIIVVLVILLFYKSFKIFSPKVFFTLLKLDYQIIWKI